MINKSTYIKISAWFEVWIKKNLLIYFDMRLYNFVYISIPM